MSTHGRKAQLGPCFGNIEFVTCLWILFAILTLVASERTFHPNGRFGKRQEPRAAAFFASGSRYGRSGLPEKLKSVPKLVEILPRVDRFFLGSRYGKRVPLPYKRTSSVNRFNTVFDYMDRENQLENVDRENEEKTNEDNLEVLV